MRHLLDEVIELMAPGAEKKRLELTRAVGPEVPRWIVADPMRLRQVLTNLVSNATKFTDEGAVTVRVGYDPEGRLLVEVGIQGSACRRSIAAGSSSTSCRPTPR